MGTKYIYDNIEVARRYLDKFHMLVSDKTLLMDMCFLPPYHWKTFYAQIFEKNDVFQAHCAYTRYTDHLGIESWSQSFISTEKADALSHKKGDIICKIIRIDPEMIQKLTEQIKAFQPEHDETCGFIIDGIFAAARLYTNGCVSKELIVTPQQDDTPVIKSMMDFSELINK